MLKPEDIQNAPFRGSTLGGYRLEDAVVFVNRVRRDLKESCGIKKSERVEGLEQLS